MLNRRQFLALAVAVPPALTLPLKTPATAGEAGRREDLLILGEDLLTQWCHGMLAHQMTKPLDSSQNGGLWSPGDGRILGRCGDAVYPFLWCARKYQDERFLDAAAQVMDWSLANVAQSDGSWKNGVKDNWRGITVFIVISLAQALQHHGDILDPKVRNAWAERLARSGSWLYNNIDIDYANINYPATNAYAMVLLGKLLNDPSFTLRGQELAHGVLNWFTEKDNLLFGEGRYNNKNLPDGKSPRGCYPVDLGYNVEESLPALAMYGLLQKDNEVLDKVTQSLSAHLEFMLPDGSWDNSWGTRNYKWTWWGSRTSDGCQPAYALLADRDPAFLEAAYRNTRLLQECTQDGILYGGPHYAIHGILPSMHHTFCHAKALATMLDENIPNVSNVATELPREQVYGVKPFSDIATWLVSFGPWRATFTAYDFPDKGGISSHASGGALSNLWHADVGPILSASMTIYSQVERFDMQKEQGPGFGTLTPRLELKPELSTYTQAMDWVMGQESAQTPYMNILDYGADVDVVAESEAILFTARVHLVDAVQKSPEAGTVACTMIYRFTDKAIDIEATVEHMPEHGELVYVLPIVSQHTETIQRTSDKSMSIQKDGYSLSVTSDRNIVLPEAPHNRIFNYVPGFEAIPITVPLSNNNLKMRIEVLKSA